MPPNSISDHLFFSNLPGENVLDPLVRISMLCMLIVQWLAIDCVSMGVCPFPKIAQNLPDQCKIASSDPV